MRRTTAVVRSRDDCQQQSDSPGSRSDFYACLWPLDPVEGRRSFLADEDSQTGHSAKRNPGRMVQPGSKAKPTCRSRQTERQAS